MPSLAPQQLEYGRGICFCLGTCQTPEVGILRKAWMASSLKMYLTVPLKKQRHWENTVCKTCYGTSIGTVLTSTTSKMDEDGLITITGVRIMCHVMKQSSATGLKEAGTFFFLCFLFLSGSETQVIINQKMRSPTVIHCLFVSSPNSYIEIVPPHMVLGNEALGCN